MKLEINRTYDILCSVCGKSLHFEIDSEIHPENDSDMKTAPGDTEFLIVEFCHDCNDKSRAEVYEEKLVRGDE